MMQDNINLVEQGSEEESQKRFDAMFNHPVISELVRLQCEIQFDYGYGIYYIKNSLRKATQQKIWVVYDSQKNYLQSYECQWDCGYKKLRAIRVQ